MRNDEKQGQQKVNNKKTGRGQLQEWRGYNFADF